MKTKNILDIDKSKSIKEARQEINDILEKLESKDVDLTESIEDYKKLIKLNNYIDGLFKKKVKKILKIGKKAK